MRAARYTMTGSMFEAPFHTGQVAADAIAAGGWYTRKRWLGS